MATAPEAAEAILDKIIEFLPHSSISNGPRAILYLAEAYAYITRPDQPHGSSPSPK